MLAIIDSVALQGLDGQQVRVEVDVSNGLPALETVGTYSRYNYFKYPGRTRII